MAAIVSSSTVGTLSARADQVFFSVGADGASRYASQAVDASYRPLPLSRESQDARVELRASERVAKQQLEQLVRQAAARHRVPVDVALAVARIESGLNPSARSSRGAIGVMQLLPPTAQRYGVGPSELLIPERNIEAGVRYLKDLFDLHDGNVPLTLSAYNAGPAAVRKAGHRVPPFQETLLYVPAILAAQTQTHPGN
jgi:soluble lytic murein transglycosylase-like protein